MILEVLFEMKYAESSTIYIRYHKKERNKKLLSIKVAFQIDHDDFQMNPAA